MTVVTGPTVLVTGAAGALGRVLCLSLPELGWTVRGLDLRSPDLEPHNSFVGSVEDTELVARAMDGADAVIHLGGVANPGVDWSAYLNVNIGGTHTVLECARSTGVTRVILASSNHAAGYVGRRDNLPANVAARPDSLYGVSKAAIESLGSFYADEYGLETLSLRIGSCLPAPTQVRHLSTWLSYADFTRLVVAAVTSPWLGHSTIWGVSRNTRRWWSPESGDRIGYHPVDDAELYVADFSPEDSDVPFVGGARPPIIHPRESNR